LEIENQNQHENMRDKNFHKIIKTKFGGSSILEKKQMTAEKCFIAETSLWRHFEENASYPNSLF